MVEPARFVLSKGMLLKQYEAISAVSDSVSFSTKTNYEAAKVLEQETGCSFSVHSVEGMGIISDKSRVWYFPQGWAVAEAEQAIGQGISGFVVDNPADLEVLLAAAKSSKTRLNLLLRMRMKENTIHTGKYFVYGFFSDEINQIIPELRKNQKIGKLGIHFHRKTQNVSEWNLLDELREALAEETLKSIDIVNIGGGFPIRYRNYRAEVTGKIFTELKRLKDFLNKHNIKLVTEPGRFIAAPAVRLEASVIAIYGHNLIINCSVYNSAMDTFVANTKLEVEGELSEGEGEPYTIKGNTPDAMDIFRYRVYLRTPKVGDRIVLLNAGAYNFSTDFCNLKRLKTEITD